MRLSTLLTTAVLSTGVLAQNANQGTHSEFFDEAKYRLPTRLLITPKTHPSLFTFTGRWLRTPTAHPYTPAYHATLWPGNSITALFYGDSASLRLRTQPQGKVDSYTYMISIDGGPEVEHNIPALDTSSTSPHTIPIFAASKDSSSNSPAKRDAADHVLTPHTVRITSIPDTPLSFEGLLVENAQINQGRVWSDAQFHRPTIEFIGEGLDAERPGGFFLDHLPSRSAASPNTATPREALLSTTHYRAAEALGVRHYHVTANTCLLSGCTDEKYVDAENQKQPLPGLEEQYFFTSPINVTRGYVEDKHHPHNIESIVAPFRFPGYSYDASVPTAPTNLVVVDLGVLDILMHGQKPEKYGHALTMFLTRVRNQAHPDAKILVLAHRNVISTLPQSSQLRDTLYTATESAVKTVGDANIIFTPVHHSISEEDTLPYLRAMCPYLLPPPGILAKTRAMFAAERELTTAERVCLEVGSQQYAAGGKGFMVGILFVGMVAWGLWVSRSTVLGAVAAVVGKVNGHKTGMNGMAQRREEEEGLVGGIGSGGKSG